MSFFVMACKVSSYVFTFHIKQLENIINCKWISFQSYMIPKTYLIAKCTKTYKACISYRKSTIEIVISLFSFHHYQMDTSAINPVFSSFPTFLLHHQTWSSNLSSLLHNGVLYFCVYTRVCRYYYRTMIVSFVL